MKTVILAAGISARLRPITNNLPKCLIKLGGKTILERMIDNLLYYDLKEIIIVTGYLQDQIKNFIAERYPNLSVTYVFNEKYEATNNIYSLWLTKDFVKNEDMLMMDSDILFDKRILGLLINSNYPSCLALRTDHELSEEEIKVKLNNDKSITEISKTVDLKHAAGESIGIEKFSSDFTLKLFDILDRKILTEKKVNIFYEAAFEDAINDGWKIFAVDIGELKCIELDFAEDLEKANKEVIQYLD
ncbi:MAG: phosphocholine cytidylyltransferase family protein [Ignavibacteriaceae bacterium]|nr:phosphocholine cytidylyltransferase family protein [Ignavibacteriaceae bacterium]